MLQSKVSRIKPATVERIESAVEMAADLLDTDCSPEEALAKAAEYYELSDAHTRLMVHSHNIGKVLEKLASTRDLSERTSPVGAIDIDRVIAMRQKQAAAVDVSPVYLTEPDFEGVETDYSLLLKDAEVDSSVIEKLAYEKEKAREAQERMLKKAYDACQSILNEIDLKIQEKLEEIKFAFSASRADPRIVQANLRHVAPAQAAIAEELLETGQLEKSAEYNRDYIHYDPEKYPYKQIREFSEYLRDVRSFLKAAAKVGADYKRYLQQRLEEIEPWPFPLTKTAEEEYPICGGFYVPPFPKAAGRPPLFSREELDDFFRVKGAANKGKSNNSSGKDSPGAKSPDAKSPGKPPVKSREVPTYTPRNIYDIQQIEQEQEQKLKDYFKSPRVRVVQDSTSYMPFVISLISQDPTLSNMDPQDVFQAYVDLYAMAPQAMKNKILAREYVKKYLEQGKNLDPYDLRLLIQMDATVERRSPTFLIDELRR